MSYEGPNRRFNDQDHDILIEIRNNLSNHLVNYDEDKKESKKRHDSLETRTGSLERQTSKIWGGTAVLLIVWEFIQKMFHF